MRYDEILGLLTEMKQAEDATLWRQAELCAAAVETGVAVRTLASDMGLSAARVRRMIRTVRAFPHSEERLIAPGIDFAHFQLCAETNDPQGWLERCVDLEWSVRDMREALERARAMNPEETEERQWAAALQRVKKRWDETPTEKRATRKLQLVAWLRMLDEGGAR